MSSGQTTDIQDRIAFLVSSLERGGSSFAIRLGLSPTLISSIIAGRRSKPSYDTLEKIKTVFPQVSGDWLLSGIGEPFLPGMEPSDSTGVSGSIVQVGRKQRAHIGTQSVNTPISSNSDALARCLSEKQSLEQLLASKDQTLAAKDELIAALKGK